MRILISLMYYRPHYSGLTIYTERLARALVSRGHSVTVLTSRFIKDLPLKEERDGVTVIRLPVAMRISKGVIMPQMPLMAYRLIRQADIVNLHVPQLDAAYNSLIARALKKPVVLTYHCDLRLPAGFVHRVANYGSFLANLVSAGAANRIVTNTRDYAENSPFLKRYLPKVTVIPPPIELPDVHSDDIQNYRRRFGVKSGCRIIGMAARLATEKGVEYLIQALPEVLKRHPNVQVHFVGQHEDVLGEELYAQKLAPLIRDLGEHWKFLGVLAPSDLAVFFRECTVTVLPSINGTESFGMVQVESMMSGTPVIASDIPGVRQPVLVSGMGEIVPPMDAPALAGALSRVLDAPEEFQGDVAAIKHRYASTTIAEEYENLFKELVTG